jgi:enoyl-CoA hydratase
MIERADRDGVAIVRLAHGKVNALDLELLTAITATFSTLDTSAHGAIVLTGAGRALSAGVDLWRLIEGGADYIQAYLPALNDAFLAVFNVGKPVVAAINGHAIAGGAILACACDHRLMAAAGGRVGVTELRVGVPFPVTALEILGFAIGEQAARHAVVSAETYPADEALARGFVDELVPAESLLDTAIETANRLAAEVPADTYRITKAQLRAPVAHRLAVLRPAFDESTAQLWIRRIGDGWVHRYMRQVTRRL